MSSKAPTVQCFGKKKTATAVAHVKAGKGLLKVNGCPINLVQPEILRLKVYEPLLLVGLDKFANLDIRVRVTGGGHTSQIYAIRQAIAKGVVSFHQKYVDEQSKNELKKAFVSYDRTLLIADARQPEPKYVYSTMMVIIDNGRMLTSIGNSVVQVLVLGTKNPTVKQLLERSCGMFFVLFRNLIMNYMLI